MKLWLRVVVSVGLLTAILVLLPWQDVAQAIANLSAGLWLLVLLGFLVGHGLGVIKWRSLVNAGRARLGQSSAVRCYSAGLFANLCLPSIVGGDVLRAALAGRDTGRGESAVVGGLADRAIDTAVLGLFVATGTLLSADLLPGTSAWLVLGILGGGAVIGSATLGWALMRPLARWPARMRGKVARALIALRWLGRQPTIALSAVALSAAMQGGFVLLNFWIGSALGIDVPLAVWFVAWPLAKLIALLPISLGGLAVRDATFGALLVPLGVPIELGIVCSLVWQSVLIVGGLMGGLVWWVLGRGRERPSSLLHAERLTRVNHA
jgi:hypothetical protein